MIIELNKKITSERRQVVEWFTELRDQIVCEFEKIEKEFDPRSNSKFDKITWNHRNDGGGEMCVMEGKVFEKIGVNISHIYAKMDNNFTDKIPGAEKNDGYFWATGISLVSHMSSPLVPCVHMNTRNIHTSQSWFGGGADLTPMYYNQKDYDLFHNNLRDTCNKYDANYYDEYKKYADDYFYIKHRQEYRGIGGIFFDYLNTNNWQNDFSFVKDVGKIFLDTYAQIVRKHMNRKWTKEQREYQLQRRGRYAEFNLMYDRGTIFGLKTQGNIRAIMMSLPPVVKWSTQNMTEIIF
ncbi:oxygen-dependent coproporphyrinogen oxidase [Anaplasmataceae bacterium AB001_6]|nr:oxygen-dependent coproporphyrinogen oxidase [Anaplasmataceae bacterium AB001_6]